MFLEIEKRIVALDAIACIEPASVGKGDGTVRLKGGHCFEVEPGTLEQLRGYFNAERTERLAHRIMSDEGRRIDPDDWGEPTCKITRPGSID